MVGQKLITIQKELKAPKKQFNKFGNYKYRSCEDILEAVKPLVTREGCALTITDEIVEIGERYYVKAIATIRDTKDGSEISVSAFAREPEDKKGSDVSQITGAASSYARKYCLNGLFLIDDTKDADVTNTQKTTTTTKTAAKTATKAVAETTYDENDLDSVKKEIVRMCTELGGQKNADVMKVVKELGNPGSLKTLEAAKEYLSAVSKIKK